jgi:hypothetical protein
MPVPTEYTDALNGLIAFRKKIFAELASGSVKASLAANHETLKKYGDLIDRLSIVPYMFGELKQKALALQISNADVGKGEISQARMEYTGNVGDYPIDTPSAISGRTLPEVDQFLYTPPDDMATV